MTSSLVDQSGFEIAFDYDEVYAVIPQMVDFYGSIADQSEQRPNGVRVFIFDGSAHNHVMQFVRNLHQRQLCFGLFFACVRGGVA